MGGITFYLFIVLTFTGVLLMFYYHPTKVQAFRDVLYLEHDVPFGKLLRNMHRWAAHLMVITVWLHMFRVFLTGSYKKPREFNWNIGVLLLVFTLLLSFTGYLLPDDQLGFWAVTVGTNMARATPLLGHEGRFGLDDRTLLARTKRWRHLRPGCSGARIRSQGGAPIIWTGSNCGRSPPLRTTCPSWH